MVIFWERERRGGRSRGGKTTGGKESRGIRKEENASFDLICPCSYDLVSLLPHSQKYTLKDLLILTAFNLFHLLSSLEHTPVMIFTPVSH